MLLDPFSYITLSLLTAHFLGDFLFQSNNDIEHKSKPVIFVKHILIITLLSYLFVGKWNGWQIPLFIFITHAVIDIIKIRLKQNTILTFSIDQFLHLAIIFCLAFLFTGSIKLQNIIWISWLGTIYIKTLILISALVLITGFSSICIGMIIEPYQQKLQAKESSNDNYDIGAGKLIGYLERFLILVLLISGNPEGIGFLITAKSILRFSEIKNSKDRAEVEYILIGTLLSFSFGIVIAYIANYYLTQLAI